MNYDNKPSHYYSKVRYEMLKYLPKKAKKILEIGCGNGCFGEEIKKSREAEIWGIEMMTDEATKAVKVLDKVFVGECQKFLNELPDNYFDAIYFNDILEHIFDPYIFLKQIKDKLNSNGVVISSIPNIRYHNVLKNMIIEKDFKYEQHGSLDFTHIRFFTGKSISRMYREAGYDVIINEGINRTKSIKPYIYNVLFFFTQMDIFYLQYATVASVKKP